MTDYLVSVGLETRTGTAKRDVQGVAESIEKVGTASKATSPSLTSLEHATDRVSLAQKRLALEQGRAAESETRLQNLRQRGLGHTQAYRQEMEKLVTAQERVARSADAQQRAQAKASGRTPGQLAARVGAGIAGYAIGRRIGEFANEGINEAEALTQAARTGQTVFGRYEAQVEEFGKGAANSIGLSRTAAVGAAADFGVLFANMKLGQGASADMSTKLVDLAAKLGLLKNTGTASALEAERSALVGEYDALQRYGINIDAAAVKQEALRLHLIRTVKDGLTPAKQAQATYSLILQQGAIAQGVFRDRTDDLTVQQMKATAAMDNARESLGQGLVPVMNGAAKVANDDLIPVLDKLGNVLGFLGKNDAARRSIEVLVGLGGGLYVLVKSIKAYREVRDVLVGTSARTVLANTAVAASYDKIALSAGKAAIAEEAAADAGGGGGPTTPGKRGIVRRVVRGAGKAVLPVAFVASEVELVRTGAGITDGRGNSRFIGAGEEFGPDGRPNPAMSTGLSVWNSKTQKWETHAPGASASMAGTRAARNPYLPQISRLAAAREAYRQAVLYTQGGYKQDAGNIPLGGVLDALPEKPDQSAVENARDAYRSSQSAVAIAQARVRQARAGTGGSSAGQIAGAQAAVLSARDAVRRRGGNSEAEALRLQAAEERLAKAKAGGTTNTVGLMSAEKSLADARSHSRKAAAELHKAEKEASGDKSISLKDILARAAASTKTASGEVANVRTLVKAGVSKPIIDELEALEKTAPGTIANVAKGLTPAYVKELNAGAAARDKAQMDLASLGSQAAAADKLRAARQAGVDIAKAMEQGYIDQLNGSGHAPLLGSDGAPRPVQAGVVVPPTVVPGPAPAPAAAPAKPSKPVHVHVDSPVRGPQVRRLLAPEIARAERQASLVIGRQG